VRAKRMNQRMMTNSLVKSLESPMFCLRDRLTAPSARENTPKRTVKTSNTANLSLSTTSERISLDLQQINKQAATTTGEMTTPDSRGMSAITGITTREARATPDPNIAKADTIINRTRRSHILIVDFPKLTLSHLSTRVGEMTPRKVQTSHQEDTKIREETKNKLMIDLMTTVETWIIGIHPTPKDITGSLIIITEIALMISVSNQFN
jgi:hypothetical protein